MSDPTSSFPSFMNDDYTYDIVSSARGDYSAHGYSDEDPSRDNTSIGDDRSTRTLLRPLSMASSTHDKKGPYEAVDPSGDDLESAQQDGYNLPYLRRNLSQASSQPTARSKATSTIFEGQFAIDNGGWWNRQMLVDRSLRAMAALMSVFALIMVIIVIVYFKDFITRENKHSTSVGGKEGSCKTMEGKNVAVHLFINIAATMILGMSNTYQQLVTALKVDEIRWVLSKWGDSRIGTNSPFAIKHKKSGRPTAILSWLLLICTSMPIHFLANSVIGPSFYVRPPSEITYTPITSASLPRVNGYNDPGDAGCWTAFRAGRYAFPDDFEQLYTFTADSSLQTYSSVNVQYYAANCSEYVNTTSVAGAQKEVNQYLEFVIGNCDLGENVSCVLDGATEQTCRLNVRMQAAFILAGCLSIKAIYMILVNLLARRKVKTQCLTFGDVIVASAIDPDLRVKNECMVNAEDGYRHLTDHTCHKHCKDPEPSPTGDSIGHCQKCKKFNKIDKAADLVHPVIAIKYKKSLISNLGLTAVTQMIILMACSVAMLGVSVMIAVFMAYDGSQWDYYCGPNAKPDVGSPPTGLTCDESKTTYLNGAFGGFGGFNTSVNLATLQADSLTSEQAAFWVSNGAQLLYSILYLLLIYNISLISMERDWGLFEESHRKPRCTIVKGRAFNQSYLLQLTKRVLYPMMVYSSLMHWLLGQAISTRETIWSDSKSKIEHSQYQVVYAAYPVWLSTVLMMTMTGICWWAFTYRREGFIPQMYGSLRACCASTTELDEFRSQGIQWGDLGEGEKFRHAGFTSGEVGKIVPAELYCGRDLPEELEKKTL
ncbi:MAG: hypothetical protein M1827_001387 [Pycnora praestabilis]|nr:MAG: hypothetical protein M1827_001387 [Pycnora praestabilis]